MCYGHYGNRDKRVFRHPSLPIAIERCLLQLILRLLLDCARVAHCGTHAPTVACQPKRCESKCMGHENAMSADRPRDLEPCPPAELS